VLETGEGFGVAAGDLSEEEQLFGAEALFDLEFPSLRFGAAEAPLASSRGKGDRQD